MVGKAFLNLGAAFSTSFGWMIALLSAVATIIAPEKTSFIVVAGAILADLFWGVAAAIKLKKFFLSTALRDTVKKIGIYSFAMLGAMAIESIAHAEGTFVAIRTIAVIAAVCEFWSMSASMLIVYPNMPFLKLLRGQLKGEIQSKVSKNVNVDDILNDDNDDTERSKSNSDSR
jgi:hypothetical protein